MGIEPTKNCGSFTGYRHLAYYVPHARVATPYFLYNMYSPISVDVFLAQGCDWRGAPMSRIRVISAGFLGTKFLHKGEGLGEWW